MKNSFQKRIFLGLTSLVILISVVFGLGALLVAYVTEDMVIERLMWQEAKQIKQEWQATGELPGTSAPHFKLYPSIEHLPEILQEGLKNIGSDYEVFAEEEHYHLQYIDLNAKTKPVLVAQVSSILVVTKMAHGIAAIMSFIAVLALLATLLLAWRLAKLINAPLKKLAEDVEANQLSSSPSAVPAEIALLRNSISNSVIALNDALAREQDFTRDVSHELRTPLTHLKNEMLLISQTETQQPGPESLQAMQKDVEELEKTLTILLAIARAENQQKEVIKLKEAIELALLKLHHQTDLDELDISIAISDEHEIRANRGLFALILQNIILNAILHGGGGLTVTIDDKQLIFQNPLSAHYKPSKGLGHGLKLTAKLTRMLGAQLDWKKQYDKFTLSISFDENPFHSLRG